jgi:hypothetical protein
MPDLSQQAGNPTSYIHDNYQELMALSEQDPEAAAGQVIQAAEGMVGRGLSPVNFKKLQMRFMKAAQRGAFGIQKAMSDYLLKGIDPKLGVVGGRGRHEDVEAKAIGSLISEDPDMPPIEWTRELIFIEGIVKQYGLRIVRKDDQE